MKQAAEKPKIAYDLEFSRRELLESGAVRLESGDGIASEQETRAIKTFLALVRDTESVSR